MVETMPSRRSVTRVAAWSVPIVVVAAAAPAYAASPCNCTEFYIPPFPSAGTAGNGWAISVVSGSFTGTAQSKFEGTAQFNPADDPPGNTKLVVQAARTICVTSGRTYRFTYDFTMYTANFYPQTAVLNVGGTDLAGSSISSEQAQTSGSKSVTWTSGVTGNVTMAFVHTTNATGAQNFGDEIKIKNVSGTCS